MTRHLNSRMRVSLLAGCALSLFASMATVTQCAQAQDRDGAISGDYPITQTVRNGRHEYYENHGYRSWHRGYYRAPPIIYNSPYYQPYGSPYYSPPPVIYGPGISIVIPG